MRAVLTALGVSVPSALGFLAFAWVVSPQPAGGLVRCTMLPEGGWYCR